MLALIRISVPDRPGVLGEIASALGASGADIEQLQVLRSEAGRALDDVHVRVSDTDHLERVQHRLAAMAGVQVLGVRTAPAPPTGHGELELIRRLLAAPARALQTLVDGISPAAGSDWAAIVQYGEDGGGESVVATSPGCPGEDAVPLDLPLRLTVVPDLYAGAALVPLGGTRLALLVVRESGPPYHPAELWRLEQVGAVAGSVVQRSRTRTPDLEVVTQR